MPGETSDLLIPYATDTDPLSEWPALNQGQSERIEELIEGVPATFPQTQLGVTDTATIDLEVTGNGTSVTPFNLSANATIKFGDLTDVSSTDVPADGEVPMWVTDHWEFAPPPIAPAGAVNVGAGLAGTGAAVDPLTIKSSGVWGQAPLDLFGTLDLSGLPVYVDSAGQLRAQPNAISGPEVNRMAADLVDKYPLGPSVMGLSGAQAAAGGWPSGLSSFVLTLKRDAGSAIQIWYYNTIGTSPTVQQRVGTATEWGPWVYTTHPPLPTIVEAYHGADLSITSLTRYTEVPATDTRATIRNPHLTKRLLVRVRIDCWADFGNSVNDGYYIDSRNISGTHVNATSPTNIRWSNYLPHNHSYVAWNFDREIWIPAGVTSVVGIGASKGQASSNFIMKYIRNSLLPLRYE